VLPPHFVLDTPKLIWQSIGEKSELEDTCKFIDNVSRCVFVPNIFAASTAESYSPGLPWNLQRYLNPSLFCNTPSKPVSFLFDKMALIRVGMF
jgi:hypothetical protein